MPARPVGGLMYDTVASTAEGAWDAVQSPIYDLNLRQKLIPELLQKIADNPYAPPARMDCQSLQMEIAQLDALLGPDLCTLKSPTGEPISHRGEYVEQGAGYAKDQAVDMVGSKVNFIPMRSVVRKLSGAEKHAKELDRAYQAGKLRRAFLKGLASLNCTVPVAMPVTAPPAR